MEQKPFVWTSHLAKKFFKLRFENEWLFKKKKQPWSDFYKLLLENDFPREMSINHVRKKWSYTYDSYRLAKKTNNKHWIYYKIFDKHYGKNNVLDKYESWNDEWRLKLVTCIETGKAENLNYCDLWRTVERAMRSQELPSDCCIQDIKGLWHYIRNTFSRKYRLAMKKGAELTEWPLYHVLVNYFKRFEPEYLLKIESECPGLEYKERKCDQYLKKDEKQNNGHRHEFQWSKDITETFIQIRLQNDWLFRKKKWAWNDLASIMADEHGFPKHLNGRELCKKWASTYGEYQKAKATNNKSWVYYNLFELYVGEGSFSLNPLIGWHKEWVSKLIVARTSLENVFKNTKDQSDAWRDVEKELRRSGLPLDHSLLDLTEIWSSLLKAFRWKKKFASKGILNEHWPYYHLMTKYDEVHNLNAANTQNDEHFVEDTYVDDDDDEIKLFDLKQRLQLKPKFEVTDSNQCRACAGYEACVNIFEQTADSQQLDIAAKMNLVGGVEVEKSDQLPVQICLTCLNDLENAFKFRRRCQDADKQFRNNTISQIIKEESKRDDNTCANMLETEPDKTALDDCDTRYDIDFQTDYYQTKVSIEPIKREKQKINVNSLADRRKRKKVYHYWKVCEVCGKNTRNLQSHLDTHAIGKMYSCEICNKKFKFRSGLVVHKAIHNPTPKKNCEVCGKSFYIMSQYRKHFMYHANERKFGCETCGKRFNTLDILRVHKRMHTDERPFSCKDCGKSFRTAGCVSRHKRIVHKGSVKMEFVSPDLAVKSDGCGLNLAK